MHRLPPRSASLVPFFNPQGVAIVGASRDPNKLSYGVVRNLSDPAHGYPGPIYPINPKAAEILGLRCYPHISAVPDPVELAILVIPAAAVPSAVDACGQRGVKAAVVISGGFREVGAEGAALETAMLEAARPHHMRIMGPNCIGVIDTRTPLNTTFVRGMPAAGHIAFLSQSGALCGGVIDWAIGRGIGFSRFLSIGNEADVNETDLITFLAADEFSRVLAVYLEDVKGGPAFVEAVRQAAARKPVLVLKAGRTAGGLLATASHTGALAGVHTAFRAGCRQAGAIEVDSIRAMFNAALALAHQPLPQGKRIAILTNSGGPAALAADALEADGLLLARTGLPTQTALRAILHPDGQIGGPVDMLGGADEHSYRQALELLLADGNCDGVLVILVPQALVNPVAVVEAFGAAAARQASPEKPVLACLMGEASLEAARRAAQAAAIPAFTFPEEAVAAFGVLRRRAEWMQQKDRAEQARDATGAGRSRAAGPTRPAARRAVQQAIRRARAAGRRVLDAEDAQPLLAAYGIATPAGFLATSPDEAALLAERAGFPVAMKLISPDVLHKSDTGGVILDVRDPAAARAAFESIMARAHDAHPDAHVRGVQVQQMVSGGHEVILGMQRDPTFGPLVMFGLGGVYAEALADVSFRTAPLAPEDVQEMIAEVRSARLLAGLRGAPPADRAALADAILRIGQLALENPEISELDVNPLIVLPAGQGALAVDVRFILG